MKLSNALLKAIKLPIALPIAFVLLLAGCGGGSGSSPPPTSNFWVAKTAMPTGRTMTASGVVNNKIYVIGGYTGAYINGSSNIVGTVEEYDPAMDKWTTKTSMPTARKGFTIAVSNGKLYAIGGSGTSVIEEYDPPTDTWTTKNTALFGATATVNGMIYSLGVTGTIYDPVLDTLTTFSPNNLQTFNAGSTTAVVNGKIYVIGGGGINASNNIVPTGIVEEYDPATNMWTTKAPMPTTRQSMTSSVLNGKIYVIGGTHGTSPAPEISTVEEYDPATDSWATKASLPTPRTQLTSETVNGKIYAIGGYLVSTSLGTVEEYTP